jgi:predicted SAM-dependent methyltransferase
MKSEQTISSTFKLKIDLEQVLASGQPVIVELGCGTEKAAGRIGIDHLDLPGVDIVADLNQGLPFLPDNSVDEIHSSSLLEHLADLELTLREIVRVLKPGGRSRAFVPHFSNPYFYSDYTHNKFFGLYTFYYFVDAKHQRFTRKVPSFYTDIRLQVFSIQYVFLSPFTGRNRLKTAFGRVINSYRYLQEFYEENLCYLVPCYGMVIEFGKPTE